MANWPWNYTLVEFITKCSVFNVLLVLLPLPKWVYIAWFMLWRVGYNLGIGILLKLQSKNQWVTKLLERIDGKWLRYAKFVAESGMGPDYSFVRFKKNAVDDSRISN